MKNTFFMNKKFAIKKNKKNGLAEENIKIFSDLLKNNFYEDYNKLYSQEILKISKSFNIRLKNRKLLFCKNCLVLWDTKTRKIRLNKRLKTKEYICLKCGYIKRFRCN